MIEILNHLPDETHTGAEVILYGDRERLIIAVNRDGRCLARLTISGDATDLTVPSPPEKPA